MEMIRMQAPKDNKSGAGFDGEFYKVNKKGVVEVPVEAHADLLSHGFTDMDSGISKEAEADKQLALLQKTADDAKTALDADNENTDLVVAYDAAIKALEDFKTDLD